MIDPSVLKQAEERMKKANLSEMMEKPGNSGPSLESWLREIQPKPKK